MEEKRKAQRKQQRYLVELHGKDFQIYTNATNICTGGAFINTLYLLNEGTFLDLKFQLPDGRETLDIRGKVIRLVTESENVPTMDSIGMAVEFTDISDDIGSRLSDICQTN